MPSDFNWPSWQFDVDKAGSQSGEIAVAISLTHEITSAVKTYIGNTLPGVGTLLTGAPLADLVRAQLRAGNMLLIWQKS